MRLLIFQSVDVAASTDFSYHQRMINDSLYIHRLSVFNSSTIG